jgi:hypothetical protein
MRELYKMQVIYSRNMKKYLFIFIITELFFSCKQKVSIAGVILNEETRQPVKGVYISQKELVKNTIVGDVDSSDNSGAYKYEHPLSGKITDSGFVTLYYFKTGLTLTRNIRNAVQDDTILLPLR